MHRMQASIRAMIKALGDVWLFALAAVSCLLPLLVDRTRHWHPEPVLTVALSATLAALPLVLVVIVNFPRVANQKSTEVNETRLVAGMLWAFCSIWTVAYHYEQPNRWIHLLEGIGLAVASFVSGVVLTIQVFDNENRDDQPLVLIGASGSDVVSREREWHRLRRGEPVDENTPLFGLALSGGGIRSATVSLGFLEGLARENVLRDVDLLSTVSGGGWAGGAFTMGTSLAEPGRSAPRSGVDWERLVGRLRLSGDYLAPGGLGFGAATLRPLLGLIAGAVVNLLAAWSLFACAILLLHRSKQDGLIARTAMGLRRPFLAHFPGLFLVYEKPSGFAVSAADQLTRELWAIDLLPFVAAAFCALVAVAALLSFAGVVFAERRWRRKGSDLAAKFAVPAITTIFVIGVFHAWLFVSAISIALVLTAIIWKAARILSAKTLFGTAAGLIAGQAGAAALFQSVHQFLEQFALMLQGVAAWICLVPLRVIHVPPQYELLAAGACGLSVLFFGFVVSRNQTGLHEFWSDRIADAYLTLDASDEKDQFPSPDSPIASFRPRKQQEERDHDGRQNWIAPAPPANRGGAHRGAPLHIINAAVNTPGSTTSILKQRGTTRFEFTPYTIGGPDTGWALAETYADLVSFSSAIGVSAAAVNSQAGDFVPGWARGALTVANLDLGIWLPNPSIAWAASQTKDGLRDPRFRRRFHFWLGHSFRELSGRNTESDTMLFVSDGGHHENLGVTALVERRCRLIIALDAGSDPTYSCHDLARAAMLLRAEKKWNLSSERGAIDAVRPKLAVEGVVTPFADRLSNPIVRCHLESEGGGGAIEMLYVKATLFDDVRLPIEVRDYAERHPDFPHESTADQFFTEPQFEAYYRLGLGLARSVAAELRDQGRAAARAYEQICQSQRPSPEPNDGSKGA